MRNSFLEKNIINKGLSIENMVDNIISHIDKNGLISIHRLKDGVEIFAFLRSK